MIRSPDDSADMIDAQWPDDPDSGHPFTRAAIGGDVEVGGERGGVMGGEGGGVVVELRATITGGCAHLPCTRCVSHTVYFAHGNSKGEARGRNR